MARLRRVLRAIGRGGADAVLLPSDSNDAWRVGDVVVRICWRGDRARFEREALVADALPASIPAARVLDVGWDAEVAWLVSAAVDGIQLNEAWPALDLADQRRSVIQTGEALAALNGHAFPAAVRTVLAERQPPDSLDAIMGADLNSLPVGRTRRLLEPASRLPGVDADLIDAVAERLTELEPVDPLSDTALAAHGGGVVVHGDAHPLNVLWNDGVVALLDLEWVRLGVPELEIEPFLHRGAVTRASMDETRRGLAWLAAAHPDAFAAPDLIRRLWLIEFGHAVRQLIAWPPDGPENELPGDHPLLRLRRIVTGPEHLEETLPIL